VFLKKIELHDFTALRCPLVQPKKLGLGKLFSTVVHSTRVPQLKLLYLHYYDKICSSWQPLANFSRKHFISFHFILFHFILFYFHFISISFYFIFIFISFHFILFHFHFISVSFHFHFHFYFISFHFNSVQFISFHFISYLAPCVPAMAPRRKVFCNL